jgi:UMP-CMP kinase
VDGRALEDYVNKGDIVPPELTVKLLIKCIESRNSKKILVDGFPRSLEVANYFEK